MNDKFKILVNKTLKWEHYTLNEKTVAELQNNNISEFGIAFLTQNSPKHRLELIDETTFMFVLRGINFQDELAYHDMIAIRIYVENNRIISVSKLSMKTVEIVKAYLVDLQATNAGDKIMLKDVLLKLIMTLYQKMEPVLEALEASMNDLEYELLNETLRDREKLSQLRLALVDYKRFLAPQKDTLVDLSALSIFKHKKEIASLKNQSNSYHRWLEKIDALKEQGKILFDEMAYIQNEKLNIRTLKLTILGGIFLPVTFLSGIFGMNVGGIPLANNAQGFLFLCIGMLIWVVGALLYSSTITK